MFLTGVQVTGTSLHDKAPWCDQPMGEVLLEPTVIYVSQVLQLIKAAHVKVGRRPRAVHVAWQLAGCAAGHQAGGACHCSLLDRSHPDALSAGSHLVRAGG